MPTRKARNPRARGAHKKAGRRAGKKAPKPGKPFVAPACKPLPCVQDNVTGWCVYHKGGGVLLTPAPRCLGPEFSPGYAKKGQGLGFSGDIGAGAGGSLPAARRAAFLGAATGYEVAGVQAGIIATATAAGLPKSYGTMAAIVYNGNPSKYSPPTPGFTGPTVMSTPIAPGALGRALGSPRGADVGPSAREGCRCELRDPDAQDPITGWLIYYIGSGVLLTPTCKCVGGGGKPPSWWAQTWINVKTLFGNPPAADAPPQPVPELLGLPAIDARVGPNAVPPVCVPDEIISRDTSPFGSGWFRVNRPGVGPLLVPNPKTCP